MAIKGMKPRPNLELIKGSVEIDVFYVCAPRIVVRGSCTDAVGVVYPYAAEGRDDWYKFLITPWHHHHHNPLTKVTQPDR